ncbi:hypothetical protein BH10PSE19_BH10PSE19_17980 [soil metagenome]
MNALIKVGLAVVLSSVVSLTALADDFASASDGSPSNGVSIATFTTSMKNLHNL